MRAFKTSFLHRLFPFEQREIKIQEFNNLHQENMNVKEYSLKFTQPFKHSPTIVADSMKKIKNFFMGDSDVMVNKCWLPMLIPSMEISCVMVHAEYVKEKKILNKLVGS